MTLSVTKSRTLILFLVVGFLFAVGGGGDVAFFCSTEEDGLLLIENFQLVGGVV